MTEVITKHNTLVPDAVAGLTTGIANIPDAMASAILAYLISSS
jgi:MFS superfamily sulfate permease-like transporter